jgi:membrane-bound lytic murein transglycosylase A
VSYSDLPGWDDGLLTPAVTALKAGCDKPGSLPDAPAYCPDLAQLPPDDEAAARAFVMTHFHPMAVADQTGGSEGLFTGYYEPDLRGAHERDDFYQTPLYGRPDNLVTVDLGSFVGDLKGRRIIGRVDGNALKPYYDRRQIDQGALQNHATVLAWVDDPVEAFFMQVQGSGKVIFPDGTVEKLGYASGNGHDYVAIGRTLVAEGDLRRETVNAPAIKQWLRDHSKDAARVMETDPSYVFFTINNGPGPVGSSGRVLVPGVSLAVDRKMIPMGSLLWLDAGPVESGGPPLRQLMLADDTGGAIRGAVRGDVFFGAGPDAERDAGMMKSTGRYWLLAPGP